MTVSTGWFGIPGAHGRGSTKVHVVSEGKPVCGARLSPRQEYQWCAHGVKSSFLECKRCKDLVDKDLVGKIVAAKIVLTKIPNIETPGDLRYDLHKNGKNIAYAIMQLPANGVADARFLRALYVSPLERGKGYAHQLILEILRDNAGKDIVLRL